jgi:hypothetical protein
MAADRPEPPPWVWEHLSDEHYNESWRRLTAWVGWLEEAYAPVGHAAGLLAGP